MKKVGIYHQIGGLSLNLEDSSIQRTHLLASPELVGKVIKIETERYAEVALTIDDKMVVDDKGLVHGGFTFSLADYAAMVAVNHPYVVLISSNTKFLKPVVSGDRLVAKAKVVEIEKRKRRVLCDIFREDKKVFEGEFTCLILERHVLEMK